MFSTTHSFRNFTIIRRNSGCVVRLPVSNFYFAPILLLQLIRPEGYFSFEGFFVGQGTSLGKFPNRGVFVSTFVPNLAM